MFLRGFNLDHGTDFATWIDGMPVNLPTHGARPGLHRPELPDPRARRAARVPQGRVLRRGVGLLVGRRRVPFYVSSSSTEGLVKAGLGEDGYFSALAADSFAAGSGELTTACRCTATTVRGPTSTRT